MIGFHCSHEQFAPGELLKIVGRADEAGFDMAMSSDHITPWSVRQGHSGFTWSWLGAALQATSLPFGSLSIPCGLRYHPALIAHAAATLAEIFPDRLPWIAAGSGEAMNEHMFGGVWPDKAERNQRLKEGVDIIRALWRGETVTSNGYIKTHNAKIWSLPATVPKIYGAALSNETAEWMGSWADGLITVQQPFEKLKALIDSFRRGGGDGKPLALQFHVSWDESEESAEDNAWDQWRSNILGPDACADLKTPEDFDAKAESLNREDLQDHVFISHDAGRYIEEIRKFNAMGFKDIFIHNVGKNQREFINFFGKSVLPVLNASGRRN